MTRAFLGLGSNLGDRARHLADAVTAIPERVAVSPVYETEPVGGPGGQGAYAHPGLWQRCFVLAPLHDLAPDLVPVGWERHPDLRRLGSLEQVRTAEP